MKKTLAILLSAVLALSLAVTCFVIVAAAAGDGGPTDAQIDGKALATEIYVITDASKAGGTSATNANGGIVLSASNPSVTLSAPASGTLTYDAATGVLTVNNVSGVASIQSWTGSFTVNVVGNNTISSTAGRGIFVRSKTNNGGVTVTSSTNGVLNMDVTSYIVYSNDGHVRFNGNVTVNINNLGTAAAVQANLDGSDHGVVIVEDNAVLDVVSKVQAIHANGANGGIYLRDNAVVYATATAASGNYYALQGQNSAPVVISGNAALYANSTNGIAVDCGELKINGGLVELSGGSKAVSGTVSGATVAADVTTVSVNKGVAVIDVAVTAGSGAVLLPNENMNSVEAGSGKVTYDASRNTLVLDNATVYGVDIAGKAVEIELKGANAVTGPGIVTDGDVTVKGTGSVAFSGTKALTVAGNLVLRDSAALTGTVSGAAITVNGGKMTVQDTAAVDLTTTGGTGIYLYPASGAAEFVAKDASSVSMTATSVALYVRGKTTNTVSVTTSGKTHFERTTTAGGAAFYLDGATASGSNTVTIANGVCEVVGHSHGVNNGVMNVGNNSTTRKSKTTVTVKDAVLSVVNDYASSNAVNNAIRLNGTDGSSFNVEGKSTVNVTVATTKTGAVQSHAVHSYGVDVNVSDTAVLNASVTAGETDTAVWVSNGDSTVEDKAIFAAEAADAGVAVSVSGGKLMLKGGLAKLYGPEGTAAAGTVELPSGSTVYAGDSADGALAEIKNTFPYASKYVYANLGKVADLPEIAVTLTDGTVVNLLRNAPWNTVKAGSGSVTYNEGTLVLNGASAKAIALAGAALKINVKGVNVLSGDGLSSDKALNITGDTLNFTGSKAVVTDGLVTLSGDLKLDAKTSGAAFTFTGLNTGLVVEDRVALTVDNSNHGLYFKPDTAGTATLIIADTATANVKSSSVPVYMEASAKNIVSLTSSGASRFERTGANAVFMISNSKENEIEIKNGTYTVTGKGGNNHNALFRIDGGNPSGVNAYNGKACDIDFVIEDATLTMKRTENNSVSVGMRLFGKDGSTLKILGDSVVTADVPSNASNADITGVLADNVDIVVGGNSVLSATARGTGSANAAATSAALRLIDSELTVLENGEVEAYAPKGGSGIVTDNGKVTLEAGTLDLSGAPAVKTASALFLASDAVIKTGDKRVNATVAEKYTDEAYALIKTEDAHEFVDITVTLEGGFKHTFTRAENLLTWDKSGILYDYANGVLTLEKALGVNALVVGEGDLEVKLVGKNEIKNVGANALNTSLNGGELKFIGEGSLLLKSDKSAALQASGTGGSWIFGDKVEVTAQSPSSALRTSGPDVAIIVTDNAQVFLSGSEDSSLGNVYLYATKTGVLEVSGEATLNSHNAVNSINIAAPEARFNVTEKGGVGITGTRFGAYVHSSAKDGLAEISLAGQGSALIAAKNAETVQSGWTYASTYVVAEGENGVASVSLKDDAYLWSNSLDNTSDANYVGLYIKSSKNAAKLSVADKARLNVYNEGTATLWMNAPESIDVDLTTSAHTTVERSGNANGAAFYLQPADADTVIDVNIKNGHANFVGASGGTNNGVVNIGYNAADPRNEKVNVNIEKAYVSVTNNYSGGTAQSVGLRIFGADGTFKVHDNSVLSVHVDSTKSGAELYGVYNSCVDMALDSSIMVVNTYGKTPSVNGAALMLRHGDMTVSGNAKLEAMSNDGGYATTVTAGNRIYFNGGISEFFGTAVTDNILAFKRADKINAYVGSSAATATDDYVTFNGLEAYARIQAADQKGPAMIYVTEQGTGAVKILTAAPWNVFVDSNGFSDIVYDPATSTVTVPKESSDCISEIRAKSGDLTVILERNKHMTRIVTENGDLTVKGKGTLSLDGGNYLLAAKNGNLTVTGDVAVEAKGSSPVIYVGGDDHDLIFAGNAKVTATGTGAGIIRNVSPSGFTYIKDNAQVKAVNSEPASWGSALDTSNFEISGGLLDLTAAGSKNSAFVGMAVSVQKAEMEAGAKAGIANFLGGKVLINVKNDSAVEDEETKVVADSRGYGLFFKNLEKVNFAGSDIEINVTNKTDAADSKKISNRAAVTWQSDNGVKTAVTLSAGTLKLSADKNTAGLLASAANSTFTMKGGSLLGEAATLFTGAGSGTKFTVNGGMVDFKAHGSIVGTAGKPTVKINASILKGGATTEDTVLVIGNPATVALPIAIVTVTALSALAVAALVIWKKKKANA